MGWTANFCDAMGDWKRPERLDLAIDRFLLHTLAYGHIGWLVEEEHGLERTCRSYYLLQAVQSAYALQIPKRLAYWDRTNLVSVSQALARDLPRTQRQLYVRYPEGLELWLNDHTNEVWQVRHEDHDLSLPPAGWLARQANPALLSYSALQGTNKTDYVRSAAYVYLDGRGQWCETPEAATRDLLAISPAGDDRLQLVHIGRSETFVLRRPFARRGWLTTCEAFDAEGRQLPRPVFIGDDKETRIEPVTGGVRYLLRFQGMQP
jgi:hypothetical protein